MTGSTDLVMLHGEKAGSFPQDKTLNITLCKLRKIVKQTKSSSCTYSYLYL